MVDRLDITHAEVPVQILFLQGITCETQRHSALYKTVGGTCRWARGRHGNMCSKHAVGVHKMHKCTHEWDIVCPWYSASVQRPLVRWLSQSGTVEQCSHVMVHCPTWSTATFGTVRIIYANHTGGAVTCVRVCVCACMCVHARA